MTPIIAFFTTSAIGRMLAKIGAAVLLVLKFGAYQRKQGVKAEQAKRADDIAKAAKRGAEGAADAVADINAGKTPQQIKDANDAKWR